MTKQNKGLFDIVTVFGSALIIIYAGGQFTGENILARMGVVWIANIAMIATVVVLQRRKGETLANLGVGRIDWSTKGLMKLSGASLLAFVIAIVAFILGSIVMANITGIPEDADMSSYQFLAGNLPMLLLSLTGVFIASSFGEELVYRGFLISRIEEALGDNKQALIWAVVLSSIVFGLAHYTWGPMGMVQTAFMGGALGISWIRAKRNLWVVIFAHAYMDFILMLQMYLA